MSAEEGFICNRQQQLLRDAGGPPAARGPHGSGRGRR